MKQQKIKKVDVTLENLTNQQINNVISTLKMLGKKEEFISFTKQLFKSIQEEEYDTLLNNMFRLDNHESYFDNNLFERRTSTYYIDFKKTLYFLTNKIFKLLENNKYFNARELSYEIVEEKAKTFYLSNVLLTAGRNITEEELFIASYLDFLFNELIDQKTCYIDIED